MADVLEMPVTREAAKSGEWLQWTVSLKLRAGDQFQACGHDVTVERIVETRPTCNLALVSVGETLFSHIGPKGERILWPALRYDGQFDRRPIAPLGQR